MVEQIRPVFDKKEYYEIRLESIGGLGANLCGKMLGELAVKYLNLNSAGFSSYGSEKTGTPVKGYIRYCLPEKEIRVHALVVNPDLLVIFHQALMRDKGVWKGCGAQTRVIIALDEGQADWNELKRSLPDELGDCYVVNAQKIAMETKSRINVVMLGAIARILGFVREEDACRICEDTLGRKYPAALEGNLKGIEQGYKQVQQLALKENCKGMKQGYEQVQQLNQEQKPEINGKKGTKKQEETQEEPEWGYQTAPIGGINPRYGSTVVADLSPSRQGYIPIFIKERCINCGLCDSTCPDMVFQFAKGEYKGREMMVNRGLDYYHCKGCMRCVDVCPVNALVQGLEAEYPNKQYFLPNQDLIRMPDYYVEAGADGYITSESYLTEKRMEGGEV
ncbi:MAG: 2-oxoacid:acceptor oxidoreductase family protein [Lachnospiraceae bacterium]|nr:2-oxoacid:acceptor oxidoreductase family protein [Lachnospiraceae bacterium]